MSTLRNLLIDCRIALRGGAGDSANAALLERLEEALQGMLKPAEADAGKRSSSQQVALAWQTAARSLKVSHPDLYTKLSDRVMSILDTRTLHAEPTDELLRMEGQLEKLERESRWRQEELDRLEARAERAEGELADLRAALEAAAPDIEGGNDPQQRAQLAIQALVRAARRTGPGIASDTPKVAPPNPVPPRDLVEQVAAGRRHFSNEQRDWTISEAMTLTAWEFTPVEMIEKGDAWLAQLLLEKGNL